MEFLKKFFNDDEKIIGLCKFENTTKTHNFIQKKQPNETTFIANYEKNLFLIY